MSKTLNRGKLAVILAATAGIITIRFLKIPRGWCDGVSVWVTWRGAEVVGTRLPLKRGWIKFFCKKEKYLWDPDWKFPFDPPANIASASFAMYSDDARMQRVFGHKRAKIV